MILALDEILAYENKYAIYQLRMAKFFHLKAAIASVMESLILLDRLLYVLEMVRINIYSLVSYRVTLSFGDINTYKYYIYILYILYI